MKNTKIILNKFIASILLLFALTMSIGFCVAADDGGSTIDSAQTTPNQENSDEAENTPTLEEDFYVEDGNEGLIKEENESEGGIEGENVFEEIYTAVESNADKIFSILAFIGTLIVGLGYKSGLLPLLRDALTKLKGAIDTVKSDGETTKLQTDEKLALISSTVGKIEDELSNMKWQYESYEDIRRDRESLRILIESQIDMLYSIFMTSALPQYQKDEVGERISEMRKEFEKYENYAEN